jgi:tetratricopeptide (TPR) repeat protein
MLPSRCPACSQPVSILAVPTGDGNVVHLQPTRSPKPAFDPWAELHYRLAAMAPICHAERAAAGEAAGNWFAAAFHLDRLCRLRPWDAEVRLRLARAYAELKQPDKAALHYAAAVLQDPRVGMRRAPGPDRSTPSRPQR